MRRMTGLERLRKYVVGAGGRRQRSAELGARGDPELREDLVQVGADRPMRQEQALADLAVREPLGGELGDLQLLRGQLVARLGCPPPAPLPRCPQLASCLVAPWPASEGVEGVARGTQDHTGFHDVALPPEPLTVTQLDPRALERPPREIERKRLFESLACIGGVREQGARVTYTDLDPSTGMLTRERFDLLHPCARRLELVGVACRLGEVRNKPR